MMRPICDLSIEWRERKREKNRNLRGSKSNHFKIFRHRRCRRKTSHIELKRAQKFKKKRKICLPPLHVLPRKLSENFNTGKSNRNAKQEEENLTNDFNESLGLDGTRMYLYDEVGIIQRRLIEI